MSKVICIDGVVGSGKTTLAELLEKKLNLKLYNELANRDTEVLLDKFYRDRHRWAFTMQIHFLNERFRMIKEVHKNGGGLLDRSIFGDKIFASMLHEDGYMSREEFLTYSTLLDNMLEHTKPPMLMIYLKCSVEKAVENIQKRGRAYELIVPQVYWKRLNEKYTQWHRDYQVSPLLEIDVDQQDILLQQDAVLEIITHKIKNLEQ
ncbi:Deoxyadenosine/deoxycytidine kinase [Geosporobacter subterraneus DSM 17957]|uniref:Deoxyadenosine/deoxycytidine kinase n=1 Tax=Geosporobacter subterraneus DSM 17957 TaxID=1121919 RepID=A0A1M6N8T5_9FIRM|nr:deoxynucleoside kinase [Geosporobacter subterraneus]SHJ92044.1 Deoxyadenosine/deoxycytidine kinase [Geosporobacter subterraneus DSM 17957]